MNMKEIRDAPFKVAPCNNPKCKDKVCKNPHCEEWRVYKNKYLKVLR